MRIDKSLEFYERAKRVIPSGANCTSKYYGRLPQGVAPPMISCGEGCYIWDYDRNKYIDWSASLGAVSLGYDYFHSINPIGYPKPESLLPMTNHLEVELAEKLVDIIPSAEMVRFFKTGSEACTAAIKLSKAVRHSDFIISCGYHGWHDWVSNKNTYKVEYGNLQQLDDYFSGVWFGRVACFILEPIDRRCPEKASKEYLQGVRDLCTKYGVILIFDEILIGFRYAIAGGEGYFSVTPDLSCYSKAMANGHPIAALTGNRELMKEIEPLSISGTFSSELISVRAALTTIKIMEEEKVIDHLWNIGEKLRVGIICTISKYGFDDIVNVKGFGPWNSFVWSDTAFMEQCYFLQEIFKRGIFYNRDHFSTFSHTEVEVEKTLEVYDEVFDEMRSITDQGKFIVDYVEGEIDKGLFK